MVNNEELLQAQGILRENLKILYRYKDFLLNGEVFRGLIKTAESEEEIRFLFDIKNAELAIEQAKVIKNEQW